MSSLSLQSEDLKIPTHLAIIMDGNGRWAKEKGKKRTDGHREGTIRADEIVTACTQLGIRYLTLYTFSSENWKRPLAEVTSLMTLLVEQLKVQSKKLIDNQIELRAQGSLEKLPLLVQRELQKVLDRTKVQNPKLVLTLCLSYGARQEILDAVGKVIKDASVLKDFSLDEDSFRKYLYQPEIPDPDLLIRTGGDSRVSNFLLWQIAYSEILVTKALWPEFTREKLVEALQEFSVRERRFGKTSEQIQQEQISQGL